MQLFSSPITAMTAAQQVEASAASTTGASSSSNTNSASITANDFLELLVSEMKNQDPTANTDPNQYINQLVQVNSLEQLIQINQDLTPSSTPATGHAAPAAGAPEASAAPTSAALAPGNLSAPSGTGASSRIADALNAAGQTLAPASGSNPLNSLVSSLRARAEQAHATQSNPAH